MLIPLTEDEVPVLPAVESSGVGLGLNEGGGKLHLSGYILQYSSLVIGEGKGEFD